MATSSAMPGGGAGGSREKKDKSPDQNTSNNNSKADVKPGSQATRTEGVSLVPPQNVASRVVSEPDGDLMKEVLSILPRGFVENTSEVYSEVASFDVVPPEKLCEYWRVYTITHRKLYDPTANRLENFWWHVWGSQRRNLSGETVARLYENISTGSTFVPLRMPTNRYDGPTIPTYVQPSAYNEPQEARHKAAQQKLRSSEPDRAKVEETETAESSVSDAVGANRPSSVRDEITKNADDKNSGTEGEDTDCGRSTSRESQQEDPVKMLSSSSSRPAPAQSILRKTRPSFSGPRPTPRFALPSGAPSEDDEEGHSSTSASDNAATSSIGSGSGSTDTNRSDNHGSQAAKPSLSSAGSSKAGPVKRDVRRSSKAKPAKKKFVVNSSTAKRKTFVSKRSGSHGSQSSEGPSSRELPSHFPPRHSGDSLIEEEEVEDIKSSALVSPSPDQVPSKPSKQQQQDQTRLRSSGLPAMTEKAAGKQPVRPQFSRQQEEVPSPTSESTAVSSMSGSTAGSVAGSAALGAVPRTATRGPRSPFAHQVPGLSVASGSLTSSGGSSLLEMPLNSRTKQPAQRPSHPSGPIPRTGARLIRQSTMPPDLGQSHRLQLGRGGASLSTASARGIGNAPPTSSYIGPGASMIAPGVTSGVAAPPRLSRSLSQDSYGSRPRPGREGYQSPVLAPVMRSATVAAPSMVAVSGVFMDAEGPDPFEVYARTGLDEPLDGLSEREQPSFMSESGSFSSSYQEQQPLQRPLFTPTRPAQTPRIPFARTRSQLNVILDREKERLGEGNFASWQESRGGRDNESPRDRN